MNSAEQSFHIIFNSAKQGCGFILKKCKRQMKNRIISTMAEIRMYTWRKYMSLDKRSSS
jgi:hypothetical protein